MSSYLSKSKKDFKPKAPVRRGGAASTSSGPTSVRGSVERQTQTPQPIPALTPRTSSVEASHQSPPPSLHPTRESSSQADQSATRRAGSTSQTDQVVSSTQEAYGDKSQESLISHAPATAITHKSSEDARVTSPPNDEAQDRRNYSQTSLSESQRNIASCVNLQDGQESTTQQSSSRNIEKGHQDLRNGEENERAHQSSDNEASSTQPALRRDQRSRNHEHTTSNPPQSLPSLGPSKVSKQTDKPRKATRKRVKQLHNQDLENKATEIGGEDQSDQNGAGVKRKRKRREPTPEDAEDMEISPTTVSMAELTEDKKMGRKSTREARLLERDKEDELKRQDRVRQEAQAFMDNPEGGVPGTPVVPEPVSVPSTHGPPAVRLAPQVRIVNGQLVTDDETRTINRHAHAELDGGSEDVHIEDELTRQTNSGTFLKRERSSKWTAEQTELFFDGLRMFGTDFGLISKMFPGRTRRQIKLKFTKEERDDAFFIKQILTQERRVATLEQFQSLSNEEYRDPRELDREMEEDRKQLVEEQERQNALREETTMLREKEAAIERGEDVESGKENDGVIVDDEEDFSDDYVASARDRQKGKKNSVEFKDSTTKRSSGKRLRELKEKPSMVV